ncbi:MAG TPA: AI-2E family transporter [Acidimicrobiales bacterium]|jgi:predicted PurR-regulated permease PerM|nr:AI-2E family transporter [Acidimicrobiales bacterium]
MSTEVGNDDRSHGAVLGGEDPQEVLDKIQESAAAEAGASEDHEYGRIGRPFDHRSPYFVGLLGALGVATAFVLAWVVYTAGHVLTLIGLAFFIAVGLDPAVTWLARHGLPRWIAVVAVLLVTVGSVFAFIALALPVVITQGTQLAHQIPHYLQVLNNQHSTLGKLNAKHHIVTRLQNFINNAGGSSVSSGVVGVGKAVFGVVYSVLVVTVLSAYLLADMPRFKRGLYQLAPRSRRARMVLLTDEVLARVGGYVLGNLAISLISAVGTALWALIFGIPYPLLLGLMVGLFDLIPIVGSTVAGVIVALVALAAVSLPVALATAVFYLVYRFLEDYVLTPRIMARTVDVPGLVTVVAVLFGGALLGIVGALVAIPAAAAIKLLLRELAVPRLEQS